MTRVVADLALLDDLVAEMAAYDRGLDVGFGAVRVRLQRLHADWDGAAAVQQNCAEQQLGTALEQMQSALLGLRAVAETAAANYRSASAATRQIWAR